MIIFVINEVTREALATTKEELNKFLSYSVMPGQKHVNVSVQTWEALNVAQGNRKCACSRWFTPSYGEFNRCPDCLANQHTVAGF